MNVQTLATRVFELFALGLLPGSELVGLTIFCSDRGCFRPEQHHLTVRPSDATDTRRPTDAVQPRCHYRW